MNEHKYCYRLNGILYFVILHDDEVERFCRFYDVWLERCD